MKKIVVISLAGLLMLSLLAGCGSKGKTDSSSDSNTTATAEEKAKIIEKIKPAAEMATQYLTLRKYDDVIAMFNEKMKEELSADKLKEAWLGVAGDIGKFEEILKMDAEAESIASPSVTVSCKFTEKIVDIRYVFDSETKISGLWFNYGKGEITGRETETFKELAFEMGFKEPLRRGFLTMPKRKENPPVVILVHGSGASDMNESVGAVKPFEDIADGLAAHGIATIRYDKRYYSDTASFMADAATLTIYDETLGDVYEAISFAKTQEGIDTSKIFVLGHSLGGMLTPKIAAENPELAGVISMAGSLRKIEDLMLDQLTEALETAELSDEEKKQQLEYSKGEYAKIKAITSAEGDTIFGYPASYWHSMNEIDGVALAKSMTMPILVLQGKKDFQVSYDKDFALWKDTLKDKKNASFIEYSELNHMMMKTIGKRDATEYDEPNNVSQAVIDDIAEFINK